MVAAADAGTNEPQKSPGQLIIAMSKSSPPSSAPNGITLAKPTGKGRCVYTKGGAHTFPYCRIEGCTSRSQPGCTKCNKHERVSQSLSSALFDATKVRAAASNAAAAGEDDKQRCHIAGCAKVVSTLSKRKRLCFPHANGTCWIAGCEKQMATYRKCCMDHSALVYCNHLSGCTGIASQSGGNCIKHIARTTPPQMSMNKLRMDEFKL